MIFIIEILRFNKIGFKKRFHYTENYGYINPEVSLAGAARAQGRAGITADKDSLPGDGAARCSTAATAKDGRGALPYPTAQVCVNR